MRSNSFGSVCIGLSRRSLPTEPLSGALPHGFFVHDLDESRRPWLFVFLPAFRDLLTLVAAMGRVTWASATAATRHACWRMGVFSFSNMVVFVLVSMSNCK